MKKCSLSLVLFVLLLSTSPFYSQTFTTTPYITIPGNNSNVDVLCLGTTLATYICWVNEVDSVYTLYLRQTSPDSGNNIVVYSDTNQIANPSTDFIGSNDYSDVRIVWQSYINNHWQILSREYIGDSLNNVISITDSLEDNTNPGLSIHAVTWIQNGNLLYKFIDSVNAKPYIIDSASCSNPNVFKNSYEDPVIVYEKGPVGNKQIIEDNYFESNFTFSWSSRQISAGGNNANPRFGIYSLVSYQTFGNSVWKSVCQLPFGNDTTNNVSYNCENPLSFIYPELSKISNTPTPLFFVYDSDSLVNNKAIMWGPLFYSPSINNIGVSLSNAKGDNYLPNISFFSSQDTTYIAVYWIHDQNGKQDIWRAYRIYYPQVGAVEDPGTKTTNFALNQNYPNPFNPSTVISWQLTKRNLVTLKVYDVLGNEIATLVNEYQNAGEHSITFFADESSLKGGFASGVYFYQLKAGNNILTKKMLYLK